jgi:hypothetical protein
MKVFRIILCALAFSAFNFAAGPVDAQTQWFSSQLFGSNTGDSDGWGIGVIGVGDSTIQYYVWATDIAAPTASHIHTGSAGQNGGIAVDFEAAFSAAGSGSWVAFGSVSAGAATIASILDDPTAFYFNVHNADHPAGAVRGQVLGGGASSTALAGTLNGDREVDNAGDPDGEGFASAVFDDGTAHFYFNVMNTAEPTAAHIHRGNASENGSIVIDPSASFSGGVAVTSVAVDDDLAREILASPHNFYFNVHNAEFATGAVRGQLRTTETVRVFPVISRTSGQAGSNWSTELNILNLTDADITAWAQWFPANNDGLEAADDVAPIAIGAALCGRCTRRQRSTRQSGNRWHFRPLRTLLRPLRDARVGGAAPRVEPAGVLGDRLPYQPRALQSEPIRDPADPGRENTGRHRPWQRHHDPRTAQQSR